MAVVYTGAELLEAMKKVRDAMSQQVYDSTRWGDVSHVTGDPPPEDHTIPTHIDWDKVKDSMEDDHPTPGPHTLMHDHFYTPPHVPTDSENTNEPAFRTFESGATRDTDDAKPRYGGFISPAVWVIFGEYMHKNRKMRDGTLRAADNWQKGIPVEEYLESLLRHVMDVWLWHRGNDVFAVGDYEEALCAVLFNTQGLLYEYLVETGAVER